jgi:hypothetical protein
MQPSPVVVLVLGLAWPFGEGLNFTTGHAEDEDEYDDEDEPKVPSCFCADPKPDAERSLTLS